MARVQMSKKEVGSQLIMTFISYMYYYNAVPTYGQMLKHNPHIVNFFNKTEYDTHRVIAASYYLKELNSFYENNLKTKINKRRIITNCRNL